MRPWLACCVCIMLLHAHAPTCHAQLKLMGISGNRGMSPGQNERIYKISLGDAATTFVRELTYVADSDSIGWNARESMLYRTSGKSSSSSVSVNEAYRDNHYMEAIDVYDYSSQAIMDDGAIVVKFNANPPPPDDPPNHLIPTMGLEGPRPTWLLPDPRRTIFQTDKDFEEALGPGEWLGPRDMAWSVKDQAMFVTSENGLFRYAPPADGPMDPGNAVFIGQPEFNPLTPGAEWEEAKAAVFYHPTPGATQLLIGMRNKGFRFVPSDVDIIEMDPTSGDFDYDTGIAVTLFDSTGSPVRDADGILALAQNPATGELYGVEKNAADPLARPLIRFRTDASGSLTGEADIIGLLRPAISADSTGAISSLAFVGFMTGDLDRDGDVDFDDLDDFVLALRDRDAYEARFDLPSRVSGDTDGDGDHDFDDIPGLVDILSGALSGPVGVPEPSALTLALLGTLGLVCLRRRLKEERRKLADAPPKQVVSGP